MTGGERHIYIIVAGCQNVIGKVHKLTANGWMVSGEADLPHPALHSTKWLNGERVYIMLAGCQHIQEVKSTS